MKTISLFRRRYLVSAFLKLGGTTPPDPQAARRRESYPGRQRTSLLGCMLFGLLVFSVPASVLAADPPPEPSKGSTVGQLVTNPITDQATTVSALITDPAETPTEGSTAFVRTSDGYVFLVKGVGERIYNQDTPPVAFNIVEVDPAAGTVKLAPEEAEGNLANLEMPTGLLYADYVTFFEGSETPGLVTPPEIVSGAAGVKTVRTGAGGKGGRNGALFVPPSSGGNGATGPEVNIDNFTIIGPTNGIGIEAGSIGGKGGNGGSSYASFWSGRDGGDGGAGGRVGVTNNPGIQVATIGDDHHGIFAYSRSGAAGNGGGGFAAPGGGTGGHSSDGGSVTVVNLGNVNTTGKGAFGIYALSVSNNGGGGGSQWGIVGKSGSGGFGGSGGPVDVTNRASGTIRTYGSYAPGILAQSVGGSGGSSGTSGNLILALQGSPDNGGTGGAVAVTNQGGILTSGDYSRGILGQSIGGGGGIGGTSGGLIALGGSGAGGGGAGIVTATNNGVINTTGIGSDGIFVQAVGGSGGSGSNVGGLVSIGGRGAKAGHGGVVTVENFGVISTTNTSAKGIVAQSIGGGGGSGGGAVSLAAGAGVSVGGSGAGGGDGKRVEVTSHNGSLITTQGNRSHGIFAQSVGGGGGDGGFAVTAGSGVVSVAVGGSGGKGGNADTVDVTMDGKLTTYGEESYGIFAQSVGGGGGSGGFAIAGNYGGAGVNVNLGLGGSGGVGGIAKTVTVDMGGVLDTSGVRAHGIFAQSVGGGGGDGGFAIAGSIAGGTSVNLAIGGDGGAGTRGGEVRVGSKGTITTRNHDAHGILAQSVGGSGGNGGFTVATSIVGGASLGLAFGGQGGVGSAGGIVRLGGDHALDGMITTHGDRSHGILAQSVGGGGGNGGASIAGSLLGPGAISLGFGGDGGSGGVGGAVDVFSNSAVHTSGVQSHGILAQSVGGGGGAGALSITGGVTAFGGLSLAMGGTGGTGNHGGAVKLVNAGVIETDDEYSYGIFAQSVGGGGGAGGSSGSVMANFSSLIPIPPQYPTGSLNIALSLGGDGGSGGLSGVVDVDNTGRIVTHGRNSYGIFAQSVGGGGGDGGKATAVTANISLPQDPGTGAEKPQIEVKVDFSMALGGNGGSGNHGNRVDVSNANMIETSGVGAHGIFAQSIGGGGGSGGDARSMILSIDPSNWSESDPLPQPGSISAGATMSIGGEGAAAGDGGEILVTNDGTIITRAADAFGIFAQSVGGGGGIGGGGYHGLDWEDFGVPQDLVPLADLLPVQDEGNVFITVGGRGGNSGSGKKVSVDHHGLIRTSGDGSIGVLAQSVGGGGGIGGSGVTAAGGGSVTVGGGGDGGAAGDGGEIDIHLTGEIVTAGIAAHGVFAQSVGGGGGFGGNVDKGITGFGINLAMAGDGAKGGDGGNVSIENSGSITTSGAGAIGIYAQSVAGGGGLRGEINEGFGFAGSAGGTGDAGRVEVIHAGDITTRGQNAHGIFAQSVGGSDYGGEVRVRVSGDISVHGEGSRAVIVQSAGASGAKNIDFIYEGGTITGGSAAAVGFFEGVDNTFTNHGTVTTQAGVAGDALAGTTGNDSIENFGKITGNIDLGEGLNRFFNHHGADLLSGSLINLGGSGGLRMLHNAGLLSPGGVGNALTSVLKGGFEQLTSGIFGVDFDFASANPNLDGGNADRLEVSGFASLGGIMEIGLVNPQYIPVGAFRKTVLNASLGVADNGLTLMTTPSVVIKYDLIFEAGGGVASGLAADFAMTDAAADPLPAAALELPLGGSVAIDYTVDFSPEGLEPNLRAVGDYINRVQSAGGSSSLAAAVTQLVSVTDMQAYRASLSQMSPEFYGHLQANSIQGSQQFGRLLFDGGGYFFRENEYLLWFNFLSERTDRDDFDGWKEANYDTIGIAFGVQKRLDDKWTAGAGFALEDHSADGYGGRWDADGNSKRIGLGINRRDGATRIGATLSYGWTEYDVDRYGMLGTPFAAHAHDRKLETFGAMLRASHEFSGESTYLRPVLDLGYTHLKGDAVRETGAGGLNLALKGFNEDHFWIRPALDVGWRVNQSPFGENWSLHLYGGIGLLHFLTDDHTEVTAGLSGAPAGAAAMHVPVELGETHTQVTVGAELLGYEKVTLGIEYTKSMSDHVDFDAWSLRFRFPF